MPVARNDEKTCIRAPNSCGEGISSESKGKWWHTLIKCIPGKSCIDGISSESKVELVAHFDEIHLRKQLYVDGISAESKGELVSHFQGWDTLQRNAS